MDNIKDKLISLKDEFYNIQLDNNDNDFIKLVKLKDVSDELYETLILIHSNYKAEIQSVKTNNYRMLTKLIDTNIDLLNRYKEIINELRPKNDNKISFITPKNIALILGSVSLFIVSIWTLFTINPDAAKFTSELLKTITNININ